MSDRRFFEGIDLVKLYWRYRSKVPVELTNVILSFLSDEYEGELNLALDVGCGSGQNTLFLKDHFKEVVGIDISRAQIETAKTENGNFPNIRFIESPSENLPFDDCSVQLVTAGQSVHWFDIPKFFEECERILCKNGVLALYGYTHSIIEHEDKEKEEKINEAYKRFINEFDEFWDKTMMNHIGSKYAHIEIPFRIGENSSNLRESFVVKKRVSIIDLTDVSRSWSAFGEMSKRKGKKAAEEKISQFHKNVKKIFGTQTEAAFEDIEITEIIPFFLLMSRK